MRSHSLIYQKSAFEIGLDRSKSIELVESILANININSDEFTQIHLQIENVALFMNIIMILQTCIMLIKVCLVSEIRKKMKNNINLLE